MLRLSTADSRRVAECGRSHSHEAGSSVDHHTSGSRPRRLLARGLASRPMNAIPSPDGRRACQSAPPRHSPGPSTTNQTPPTSDCFSNTHTSSSAETSSRANTSRQYFRAERPEAPAPMIAMRVIVCRAWIHQSINATTIELKLGRMSLLTGLPPAGDLRPILIGSGQRRVAKWLGAIIGERRCPLRAPTCPASSLATRPDAMHSQHRTIYRQSGHSSPTFRLHPSGLDRKIRKKTSWVAKLLPPFLPSIHCSPSNLDMQKRTQKIRCGRDLNSRGRSQQMIRNCCSILICPLNRSGTAPLLIGC